MKLKFSLKYLLYNFNLRKSSKIRIINLLDFQNKKINYELDVDYGFKRNSEF